MNENYTNRELDSKFEQVKLMMEAKHEENKVSSFELHKKVDEVLVQTKITNGRVNFHDKVLLVVATALLVLLVTNGSKIIEVFKIII